MTEDTSILQEIDDAVRVERLQQFWERSGNLVIAACVGIVLLTAASVLWKNHQHDVDALQTGILLRAQALSDKGKYEEAAKALEEPGKDKGNLQMLAHLRKAEALEAAGQSAKAAALYTEVANRQEGEEALRDFAALRAGILAGNAHKPIDITKQTEKDRPFAFTASELKAARLLNQGKGKEAAILLQTIADDATVTSTQRARALELLDMANEEAK